MKSEIEVNDKGQIVAENGLRWFKYTGEAVWWTRGISRGAGFRIEPNYANGCGWKRWHLYSVRWPSLHFYGSVSDCMRVAEMWLAVRGL